MSDVIIYTTEDGTTKIDLRLDNGTAWLSQLQIAELFQTTKQNISKHIQAIYDDQELDEQATVNQQLTVQNEGRREVSRTIALYNLDVILAVGYRVRSVRVVQFRRYAYTVLKRIIRDASRITDQKVVFQCPYVRAEHGQSRSYRREFGGKRLHDCQHSIFDSQFEYHCNPCL